MNDRLLVDCCTNGGIFLNLNESTTTRGLTKFEGKFQEAEAINKNKRLYPFSVLSENIKSLKSVIESRGLVGELDHPTDSIIHFENSSHIITKLWWEGNVLMGQGEILNTPCGKLLKSLINDGVRVGISSRGVGNGKVNENGILVIGESYKLITFDAVADPSTHSAFQQKIASKKENYECVEEIQNNSTKSQSSSIHSVNKEALIACLGGLIQQETNCMKSKI
jgi:hypothetical protein